MPHAKPLTITEDLDELRRLLHAERQAERKRRLHMLVLVKEDPSRRRSAVADHLAVHRNTITVWLERYSAAAAVPTPGCGNRRA